MKLPEGEYWKYLRKSRADLEAESRGEGETLAKHDRALNRLAKEHNILITEVFKEVESGESLYYRTEILRLLEMIATRKPKGVFVMDIDRFGRGNMQEQGLILSAFKENNVLIVTPRKIYDLNNEFDEEYSEFEAFMARKELKIITRRMQGGRVRSVEEGNYIGTRPPYGYLIHKEGKSRFLVPHPVQSEAVRLIFELYTHPDPSIRVGSNKIANELNKLPQYQTYTGKPWEPSTILNILKNEVYLGKVQWKKKEQKKSKTPGKKRDTRTRSKDEWINAKGKHEPLVSEEIFNLAQEILKGKYHVPYQLENGITNPLAGIIRCGICGKSMVLRPYTGQQPHLVCYQICENKSSRFEFVERKVLIGLEDWLKYYKAEWRKHAPKGDTVNLYSLKEGALKSLQKELVELESQVGKLHDFLERGIYNEETYLERSRVLSERIAETKQSIKQTEKELELETQRNQAQKDIIPKVQSVLKMYHKTSDPAKKNAMLKSVLEKVVYTKERHQRNDEFLLVLHPKRPRIKG